MHQRNGSDFVRLFLKRVAAALMVLLLTALAGAGYVLFFAEEERAVFDPDRVPPVVKAEVIKVTPADPGGMEIPHQDKLVFSRLTAGEDDAAETVVMAAAAEEPYFYPASEAGDGTAAAGRPGESPPGRQGGYVAQLASFARRAEAEDGMEKIESRYPDLLASLAVNIQRADLGDRGVWHRLHVGYFPTRSQAREACHMFKAEGFDCKVTIR